MNHLKHELNHVSRKIPVCMLITMILLLTLIESELMFLLIFLKKNKKIKWN